MKPTIQRTLFSNWHTMRWLALGIGLFFAVQAVWYWDGLAALFGVFFLFQAVTNSGCMGSRSCAAPVSETKRTETAVMEGIEYTEIKED